MGHAAHPSGEPDEQPPASPTIVALLDRCSFPAAGTPVVCALSGGADSAALTALAVGAHCRVTAVHVHHGLRAGADDDAALAVAIADRLGVDHRIEHVDLEDGPNLEARARDARRAVLGPEAITGHTADDQAETLLINLLRGTGLRGLGAMQPGPRRPILALRRSDTVAICELMGWSPVLDPSNTESRFVRNRVRNELVPLLADIAGRDVVPLLCRSAGHARSAADFIAEAAAGLDPSDARAVTAAPDAVAAAAVAEWVRQSTGADHPPDAAAIERVLSVAAGRNIAAEVGGGWRVSRSRQRLSIS